MVSKTPEGSQIQCDSHASCADDLVIRSSVCLTEKANSSYETIQTESTLRQILGFTTVFERRALVAGYEA